MSFVRSKQNKKYDDAKATASQLTTIKCNVVIVIRQIDRKRRIRERRMRNSVQLVCFNINSLNFLQLEIHYDWMQWN